MSYSVLILLCMLGCASCLREYIGCFEDRQYNQRAMDLKKTIPKFKHDLCEAICTENNLPYMAAVKGPQGLEMQACFCGAEGEHEKYGEASDPSQCEQTIQDGLYTDEKAANVGYLRVYKIKPRFRVTGEELIGCFHDKRHVPSNLIPGDKNFYSYPGNAHSTCALTCRLMGNYNLYGLRQRNFCFCGKVAEFDTSAKTSTCTQKCKDTKETCGGKGEGLEVYSFTAERIGASGGSESPKKPAKSGAEKPGKNNKYSAANTDNKKFNKNSTASDDEIAKDKEDQELLDRILYDRSIERVGRVDGLSEVGSENSTWLRLTNALVIPESIMNNKIRSDGKLIGWKILAVSAKPIHLGIWRPSSKTEKKFTYIGGTTFEASRDYLGVRRIMLNKREEFGVKEGDVIGFWWGSRGTPTTYRVIDGRVCNDNSRLLIKKNEPSGNFSRGDQKTLIKHRSKCGLFNVQAYIAPSNEE